MFCFVTKALEFLLWAAMCLETSIPLLGVKYLTWRVTLYSAICLAYYDCKAGHHAEVGRGCNFDYLLMFVKEVWNINGFSKEVDEEIVLLWQLIK